ncbi:MAG: hypothetical protein AB1644_12910 [Candidatus Zixiibacteriota bacterium]
MKRILLMVAGLLGASTYGATYYVTPNGAGTRAGSTWANAGNGISWVNSRLQGGDTVFFGPGTYNGVITPPANLNSRDRTCYVCGDGRSNAISDPGLMAAKACTLSAATVFPRGTTWTNFSGGIYYTTANLPEWEAFSGQQSSIGGQDTTMLRACTTPADMSIVGPGSYCHDLLTNRIYVWCTDGVNPTNHTIYASRRSTIEFTGRSNSNYVTFFGFDIRWSFYAGVHLAYAKVDSVFIDHCRITRIGTNLYSNAGIVGTQDGSSISDCGGSLDCTYAFDGKYCRIRSCYGGLISEPFPNGAERCNLITTYGYSHFTVESCYADALGGAVDWKNRGAGGHSKGNVLRFSTVANALHAGYQNLGNNQYDSCYGNVFINCRKAIWFERYTDRYPGHHFVCNNTIYGFPSAGGVVTGAYQGDFDSLPNFCKYNIFYDNDASGDPQFHYFSDNDTNFVIDSNLYWNCENTFVFDALQQGWTAWRNRTSGAWAGRAAHDAHSSFNTVNPGFTNAAGGDFSRPSAGQEMNVTYGGKTWTRYGAWQAPLCLGCVGKTGNIDGSPNDVVDIGDLQALISYLFGPGGSGGVCLDEANVDGSANGTVDIQDLTLLVSYLIFNQGGTIQLAPCQ